MIRLSRIYNKTEPRSSTTGDLQQQQQSEKTRTKVVTRSQGCILIIYHNAIKPLISITNCYYSQMQDKNRLVYFLVKTTFLPGI